LSHNGNPFSQYTSKGFTGQYNDPTSGLDYYVSRYYDAVSGVFLSADETLGDATGMNPYNYVGNNPETFNDPTGQMYYDPGGGGSGSGGSGGGCGGSCGGNNYGNIGTSPPPPVVQIRTEEKRVIREAEQILQWAWDHPAQTVEYASEATAVVVVTDPAAAPIALAVLGFVTGFAAVAYILSSNNTGSNNSSSSTPNYGPTPTPGSDIQPPQSANSLIEHHDTDTPSLSALSGSGDGGAKGPPTQPTAAPSGDDGFGRLSGNQYRVSEKGIRTIESHLSRPDFIDSFTGNTALEEPENATMLARLWSALEEGRPISGSDASFYFHELYENTLMEDGIIGTEAHQAAINRYGVSPFSIYHPDAIMANPAAFGPPYFEFWRITP
jgi:RHS repeat-associated protein